MATEEFDYSLVLGRIDARLRTAIDLLEWVRTDLRGIARGDLGQEIAKMNKRLANILVLGREHRFNGETV